MRIREYLERAGRLLKPVSESPVLDGEVLLAFVLARPREFLWAHPEFLLSAAEQQLAGILLQKRLSGHPVAHLTQSAEFYGERFWITPDVLVPRPETETLVALAAAMLAHGGTLLDIGTGSGCIAISVAKSAAPDRVIAADISPAALLVARENARRHGVLIEFFQSDLLAGLPAFAPFKRPLVVAANLPYVPDSMRHPSTVHEPASALYAGADGLDCYRRFFVELSRQSFDFCLFEFHPPQLVVLRSELKAQFPGSRIVCYADLAGRPRIGVLAPKAAANLPRLPFLAEVAE